jgi:hypothetical protein
MEESEGALHMDIDLYHYITSAETVVQDSYVDITNITIHVPHRVGDTLDFRMDSSLFSDRSSLAG